MMDQYLSGSGVLDEDNSTIATTSCAVSSFNTLNVTYPPLYIDFGIRAVNFLQAFLLLLLGNAFNTLTLIVIARYKELHTLPFAIAAQIAVSNITEACVIGFPGIINNSIGRWVLGVYICVACAFFRSLCSILRLILFFIFSFDRFAAVFFPFSYPKYSHRIMITACALAWSTSLIIGLIPIPSLLDCYGFIEATTDCFWIPYCSKSCQIFGILWIFLFTLPCSFLAAGFFVTLYIKGRKIRKEESKMLGLSSKTISDSDWKALKTISLLFGCFLTLSFLPKLLFVLHERLHGIPAHLVESAAAVLFNMVLFADPIIILRNADARKACKKLQSDIKERWSHCCQRFKDETFESRPS